MSIVQSKTLVVLSIFLFVLTAYSAKNTFEAGVSEGLPLLVLGIVNDLLGAITAAMILFGRRSAFKWFYAMSAGAFLTIPIVGMRIPEAYVWLLAMFFLFMPAVCGILWSILWWKKDALNQPVLGVMDNA
jgi:hypothetical protein